MLLYWLLDMLVEHDLVLVADFGLYLEIFDVLGKRVKILVDEHKNAGNYNIEFNSKKLSSGTYFYRIKAGEFSDVKKMLLLK